MKLIPQTRIVHFRNAHDIYIGRPSRWGNPFEIGKDGAWHEVIKKYEEWIRNQPELLERLGELEGHTLGCWCKPDKCHGDILLKLLKERKENKILKY